jgi:hypothetical protein
LPIPLDDVLADRRVPASVGEVGRIHASPR